VRYFYTGAPPVEVVTQGEAPSEPQHAKTRALSWFGRTLLHERILWVRVAPDLRVALDGVWADLAFARPARKTIRMLPRDVKKLDPSTRTGPVSLSETTRRAATVAARPRAAKRYANAWVVQDRADRAGDNGEALFRRLRTNHPEINAWFVIAKDTPDWQRLRREFGRRVVAHGSLAWRVLMTHCVELLSSHADPAIVRPPELAEKSEPRWRFTFLQHGVNARDVALDLADRPIDLFITSTPQEYAAIAGDGTAYPFTTKEVRLTGLARFDTLLGAAARVGPEQRDLVLVAPTWRRWLARRPDPDSDFARAWSGLIGSPELVADCERLGLTVAVLPHPTLEPLIDQWDLPGHVQRLRYAGEPVAEVLARTRLLVTDYASVAFDAAYLDRPVVYFRFDEDVVLTGGHVGRQGWFDARRDGFGPVADTLPDAVDAVRSTLVEGMTPTYSARVAAAFPERDGNCAERIIAAVREAEG
jgi:hypothetical protein